MAVSELVLSRVKCSNALPKLSGGAQRVVVRNAILIAFFVFFVLTKPISAHAAEFSSGLPSEIGILTDGGNQAAVQVWQRSAREQGLAVSVVTPDEVTADFRANRNRFSALVLPDGGFQKASVEFVDTLTKYVKDGGNLLVVYDAGIFDEHGQYANQSTLSDLAGVDYGIYGRDGTRMYRKGTVFASAASMQKLAIPPGVVVEDTTVSKGNAFRWRLTSYANSEPIFSSFTTTGRYDGAPLLQGSEGQIVAGIRLLGNGTVIFANVPLGYLKRAANDGWLLHRFLHLLGEESDSPVLAMTPRGVGGMIMNIHACSKSAVEPLQKMINDGFFKNGPFSVHITAGPDWDTDGDALGFDVAHHQALVRALAAAGHEIGSHGGWIHNYWAAKVTENSAAQDEHLLLSNERSLEEAIGKPIRVYSDPGGVHPQWVTRWLEEHHFVGYYTTGNHDSAPTRAYRSDGSVDQTLWSFPISTLEGSASFEEAAYNGLGERSRVTPFLEDTARFASDQHEVRLFYFHPTGVHLYRHALAAWVAQAKLLGNRFKWYTIEELSLFLDRREQTHWHVTRQDDGYFVEADAADSLRDLSWLVPAVSYARPRVMEGLAEIRCDGPNWVVSALQGRRVAFFIKYERHKPSDVCAAPGSGE